MRIPWELLLLLAVLVAAAAGVQLITPDRDAPPAPDLAVTSTAPGGGRALYLWLQSLGYAVDLLAYDDLPPSGDAQALLLLAPSTRPARSQLASLRRWVERGGTLIVAGDLGGGILPVRAAGLGPNREGLVTILGEFGLALSPLPQPLPEATPTQPLLLQPVVRRARVEATSYVTGSGKLVSYLGDPRQPVAAGLVFGRGLVYVLASTHAFANQGLNEADNAALLLSWLPGPPAVGTIVFGEAQQAPVETRSLAYVLAHKPWGWATLYVLGMTFLYLLLGGRRFGRAVPSVVDLRRAAAEYVVSVANLLRRGGQRQWAARHYERRLRQQLAVATGLDPALDTLAMAMRLQKIGQLAGGVEGRRASEMLLDLHAGAERGLSESQLVRLAMASTRLAARLR